MGFQRDILPLPLFDDHSLHDTSYMSRGTRRRLVRRNLSRSWENDAVRAINDLGGHKFSALRDDRTVGVTTRLASAEIANAFAALGAPDQSLPSPESALTELLGSTSAYNRFRLDVMPYARDKVSWPPLGSTACALADGFSESDKIWLADWNHHMIKDSQDNRPSSTYNIFSSLRSDLPDNSVNWMCNPVNVNQVWVPDVPTMLQITREGEAMAQRIHETGLTGDKIAVAGMIAPELPMVAAAAPAVGIPPMGGGAVAPAPDMLFRQ